MRPAWALVYGALYAFLIVLPVLVIRDPEHIRRSVYAYLLVWLTAYVCFLAYPTVAPRPDVVPGDAPDEAYGCQSMIVSPPAHSQAVAFIPSRTSPFRTSRRFQSLCAKGVPRTRK